MLANEQVDHEGRSWRSGAQAEERTLDQWFFRITHFADDLLEALPSLDAWPEKVRTMQHNWIGPSSGVEVDFALEHTDPKEGACLRVFTTRADTMYVALRICRPEAATDSYTAPPIAPCQASPTHYPKMTHWASPTPWPFRLFAPARVADMESHSSPLPRHIHYYPI